MQNNNNYSSTLDPELQGSVDFDFFAAEENDNGNKENLSTIEEIDAVSRQSGDNSLKSGSIEELGCHNQTEEDQRKNFSTQVKATLSKSSSSSSSASSSPRVPSSTKSESTVRSGGFPPIPRGDSTRPQSPTPPSSHASPSPHRVASAPRSVSPPNSPPQHHSSRSSSVSSERSRRISSGQSSRSVSPENSKRSVSPETARRSVSPDTSRRSVSPDTSRRALSPDTSRRSVSPEASKHSATKSDRSTSSSSASSRSSSPNDSKDRKNTCSSSSSASSASSRSPSPSEPKDERAQSSVSSESDVTDVSPLSSRQQSPLGSPSPVRKPPAGEQRARVRISSRSEPGEVDNDRTNVELIMRAILELDRERQRSAFPSSGNRQSSGRAQSERRSRRRQEGPPVVHRPYHSTINRVREQRRIEEENQHILRRLTAVRPTPNMRRDKQLRDYERQSTYGAVNLGKTRTTVAEPRPGWNRSVDVSTSSSVSKPNPRPKRRPASAKSAPTHTRSPLSTGPGLKSSSRPEWPSGW